MLAIYKRELRAYFTTPMGYLLTAFLLFVNGLYFSIYNLQGGYGTLNGVLFYTLIALLLFCPLLTMRTFAEERRQHTDSLLLAAPVGLGSVVLAKFFSALTVLCLPLAVLCSCVPVLALYGSVEAGLAFVGIAGYLLVGAACIAVGIFFSALTEKQLIAGLLSFAVLLAGYLMDGLAALTAASTVAALLVLALLCLAAGGVVWYMAHSLFSGLLVAVGSLGTLCVLMWADVFAPGAAAAAKAGAALGALLQALALFAPYYDWLNGVFTVSGLVYYLSVTVLFLFMTAQLLQRRRYD